MWDAEIARVKGRVGSPPLRLQADATTPRPAIRTIRSSAAAFDAVLPILTKAYREVTEYAEQKGRKRPALRTTASLRRDAERVEKLINAVGIRTSARWSISATSPARTRTRPARSALWRRMPSIRMRSDFHKKNGSLDNPGEGWFQSRARNYLRGSIIGHGDVPVDSAHQRAFAAAAMTGI